MFKPIDVIQFLCYIIEATVNFLSSIVYLIDCILYFIYFQHKLTLMDVHCYLNLFWEFSAHISDILHFQAKSLQTVLHTFFFFA